MVVAHPASSPLQLTGKEPESHPPLSELPLPEPELEPEPEPGSPDEPPPDEPSSSPEHMQPDV
jgi:hypothetical protein